jgi:hypothetical protein
VDITLLKLVVDLVAVRLPFDKVISEAFDKAFKVQKLLVGVSVL